MIIQRIGSQPSTKQPATNFTGSARRDQVFAPDAPAMLMTSTVTFEPGARTAWHTHPLGQLIIITAGIGWVQVWGKEKQEVRQGDIAWFEPGEKHWHGATDTVGMTHIAVVERKDGSAADWLEQVSDDDFLS
jgi:quercetin dioxygenase-like cupin family protein